MPARAWTGSLRHFGLLHSFSEFLLCHCELPYLPMAVCWPPFHTCQTNSKGVAASLPLVPLSWLLAYAVVFLLDYNKLFSSFLLKFLHWWDQDYKVGTWMSLVPLGTPGRAPQIRDKNFKEATFLANIWEIPSKTQRHIHRVLWIDE